MYNERIDLVRSVQITIIFEPYLLYLPYYESGYLQTVCNFDSDATNNN